MASFVNETSSVFASSTKGFNIIDFVANIGVANISEFSDFRIVSPKTEVEVIESAKAANAHDFIFVYEVF